MQDQSDRNRNAFRMSSCCSDVTFSGDSLKILSILDFVHTIKTVLSADFNRFLRNLTANVTDGRN